MPVGPVGIGLVALIEAISILALAYGLRELRLAWLVLRSRPVDVLETTRGGPVELRGTARPARGVVESPFTETACLAYEYAVEEERNTENGRTWETIDSGEGYVPFRLEDDSGSVLIEPPGASLRLSRERRIDVEGGARPPEPIRRFVEREDDVDSEESTLNLGPLELKTGRDRRYVERRLDVGEEVHVLGTARYDTTASKRAGDVNAVVGVDEAVLSESRWVRIRHRLFGHPFVISDRSERWLGIRAAGYGAGAILGGVVLGGLAALWALWALWLA